MFINFSVSAQRSHGTGLQWYVSHEQNFLKQNFLKILHEKLAKTMTPTVTLTKPGCWFKFSPKNLIVTHQLGDQIQATGSSFNSKSQIPLLEDVDVCRILLKYGASLLHTTEALRRSARFSFNAGDAIFLVGLRVDRLDEQ